MGFLYVSEFANSANSKSGAQMQMGVQPANTLQKLDFSGGTNLQSNVFSEKTHFIRIYTTVDCHLAFGIDPVATADTMFLPAGTAEYFGILRGHRLAVLRHTGH